MRWQCSILIVDDEELTLLAMTEYFTHRGFTVDGARSVWQAERLLAANCYAAMITDLQLTAGNDRQGFDLITYVRQHWPSMCIILLTADGSPEVKVEARRRGVEAFLHKPLSLSNVEQTVRGLLASRHDSHQR
jgi:two-component system, NtrC family, response regulator PilR